MTRARRGESNWWCPFCRVWFDVAPGNVTRYLKQPNGLPWPSCRGEPLGPPAHDVPGEDPRQQACGWPGERTKRSGYWWCTSPGHEIRCDASDITRNGRHTWQHRPGVPCGGLVERRPCKRQKPHEPGEPLDIDMRESQTGTESMAVYLYGHVQPTLEEIRNAWGLQYCADANETPERYYGVGVTLALERVEHGYGRWNLPNGGDYDRMLDDSVGPGRGNFKLTTGDVRGTVLVLEREGVRFDVIVRARR